MDGVADVQGIIDRYNEVMAMWADPDADYDKIGKEQAQLEDKIAASDAWSLERNVEIAMDALRCPPDDADVTMLSGGERRRVALCRLLLSTPTCCCSTSRPTTSTPSRSTGWSGSSRTTPARSSPSPTTGTSSTTSPSGSSNSTAARASPSRATTPAGWSRSRSDSTAKSEATKPASARWHANSSGCGWAPRPARRRARPAWRRYDKLYNETKAAETTNSSSRSPSRRAAPRRQVIEVEHLRKGFGDRLLIDDLSFTLPPAGIVGIIGPNGAGKSTLFKMLAGREQPDSGSIKIGETVDLSYVDQDRDDLDPDATVFEEITGGVEVLEVGGREIHGRAYVSSFNFKGTDHGKRVGDLSGGERNRVHLAEPLKSGGNVLLLDEPTNDLDVDTLRALEAGLEAFPGCAVVISHDRWFLDRIATHVLAFEGDSQVRWFEGNFTEYEEYRKKRARRRRRPAPPHQVQEARLIHVHLVPGTRCTSVIVRRRCRSERGALDQLEPVETGQATDPRIDTRRHRAPLLVAVEVAHHVRRFLRRHQAGPDRPPPTVERRSTTRCVRGCWSRWFACIR